MTEAAKRAASTPSRADRVYGAVAGVALLLALFFLFRGGVDDGKRASATNGVPRLVLVEPAAGAAVAQPVALVFDAGTALGTDGADRARGNHVHVRVGGTELMSGPGSLRALGGTRYRWTLPAVPAGEQALRLYWSDARHRALAAGASGEVKVTVR
jgi:hypothetical protein